MCLPKINAVTETRGTGQKYFCLMFSFQKIPAEFNNDRFTPRYSGSSYESELQLTITFYCMCDCLCKWPLTVINLSDFGYKAAE